MILESFADVLHTLIDHVFAGDLADRAHDIIDRASGTRTAQPEQPIPTTDTDTDTDRTVDTGSDASAET